MHSEMVTAYVAVGSNLGDRAATITEALRQLELASDIQITRQSSLWNNPAIGGPADSPDFLNGVIEVRTALNAPALLQRLLDIESKLGRERREPWAPRTIDLDLLLYGNAILHTPSLTLPHPRLRERRFVLQPLSEIAPTLPLPTTGERISALLNDLTNRESLTARDTTP